MRSRRRFFGTRFWLVVLLLGAGLLASDWVWPRRPTDDGTATSSNLSRDIKRMWETERLWNSSLGGSSNRAILAASRVFNSVSLLGLTRNDVLTKLGDPATASDSCYANCTAPAPPGSLVYRFDNGAWGWQFTVIFDDNSRVSRVDRLGIE